MSFFCIIVLITSCFFVLNLTCQSIAQLSKESKSDCKIVIDAGWHKFAVVLRSTTRSGASWKFKFFSGVSKFFFFLYRELMSFDPWHVTCSPPTGKCIGVGRYNKSTDNKLYKYRNCKCNICGHLFILSPFFIFWGCF